MWRDLDLMEIYTLAPCIAVKNVIENGRDFVNRYWGTGMTQAYGLDATGLRFSDYLEPDAVEEGLALHRQVVETAEPLRSYGNMSFWHAKDHITFEGVICPLQGDDGAVNLLISYYDLEIND